MKEPGERLLNFRGRAIPLSAGWFAMVIAVGSCLPAPLELEDMKKPPIEIVVSSLVLPDSSVAVLLTRSIGALEANAKSDPQEVMEQIAINDAEVIISTGDSVYALQLVQNGMYQSRGIPLIPGGEYHLRVVSASLGEVTSATVLPPRVSFDTVSVGKPAQVSFQYLTKVAYKITDPLPANYYVINVQDAGRKYMISNLLRPDSHVRLVSDAEFNGRDFSETFDAVTGGRPRDTMAVSLSNVSPEYFEYVRLREENDLELVEIFSEPIDYPTNIRGGRGFFALHLMDLRLIPLRK